MRFLKYLVFHHFHLERVGGENSPKAETRGFFAPFLFPLEKIFIHRRLDRLSQRPEVPSVEALGGPDTVISVIT